MRHRGECAQEVWVQEDDGSAKGAKRASHVTPERWNKRLWGSSIQKVSLRLDKNNGLGKSRSSQQIRKSQETRSMSVAAYWGEKHQRDAEVLALNKQASEAAIIAKEHMAKMQSSARRAALEAPAVRTVTWAGPDNEYPASAKQKGAKRRK